MRRVLGWGIILLFRAVSSAPTFDDVVAVADLWGVSAEKGQMWVKSVL